MTPPRILAAADAVRKMIADGALKPGGSAPSARTLHGETGISETYCLRALRLLVDEGTLERPGRWPRVPARRHE